MSHVDDRQFRKRFPGSRSSWTSSEQLPLISFFLAYRLTIASTMLRNRPVLPRYRSPRLDRPGTMPRSYCSSRKQTHGALVRRERRTANVHGTSICMIMRTGVITERGGERLERGTSPQLSSYLCITLTCNDTIRNPSYRGMHAKYRSLVAPSHGRILSRTILSRAQTAIVAPRVPGKSLIGCSMN